MREMLVTNALENLAQRLRRVALAKLPAWQLLGLAAAVGAIWAASLFDWRFVGGGHPYWRHPHGAMGGAFDMAQVLVGYFYYVQSPWGLPLFYVSALHTPTGTNVIFMDVVPVVALAGKLILSLTGTLVNPYGAYLFLCFALPGVMMTLVLIAARARFALAAIIGAVFAITLPALLWQWGHIAIEGHFLLIGALALYLFSLEQRAARGLAAAWGAWLTLAYLTNMYLFAMVGIVWLCTLIQQRLNRLRTTRNLVRVAALTVAVVTAVITLSGQFGVGAGLPFGRYGFYSMNLLSPFLPQKSGLVPGLGGVIDATGGQYEGYNYLGLGLLLASVLVLPSEIAWFKENYRRHVSLLVAFAALVVFAISHRLFAGHRLLFELPIPKLINPVLGIFRSSGRFFWLIGYAQIAMVVVLVFRRAQPVIILCLVGTAILQIFDVQPLRQQIIASIASGPSPEEFDNGQVTRLVARAHQVEVVPSFICSAPGKEAHANIQLMLAAARTNVPTNTVYLGRENFGLTLREILRAPSRAEEMRSARGIAYCKQEIERAQRGGALDDVFVLLSDRPSQQEMAPDVICSALSWARYCERPAQTPTPR